MKIAIIHDWLVTYAGVDNSNCWVINRWFVRFVQAG